MTPRASILVPTHNHASTLELAVGSALAQTVHDVEVLIIGDGVTPEVRAIATRLTRADGRVRFFDHPKGKNHGEEYRDTAIRDAVSNAIFYLCDDDLFMPHHVADLLALLQTHTFVQCKNGCLRPDGRVHAYAGDLANPRLVARVLDTAARYNFVSLTGTAHSREFYLRAESPWTTTPGDEWPDLFQWRKLLANARFSGATSDRMTALQCPTSADGRETWTADERLDELRRWAQVAASKSGQEQIDVLVARAHQSLLVENLIAVRDLENELAEAARRHARELAEVGRDHATELGVLANNHRADLAALAALAEVNRAQGDELAEARRWQARRGQVLADRVARRIRRLPGLRRR